MRYGCVFLDWDGTLSRSRFWGCWEADPLLGSAYSIIQRRFFGAEREFLRRWMRGGEGAESASAFVAKLCDLPVCEVLESLERSCRSMEFVSGQIPALVSALRAKGARVVVATDNMDTFSRWTVPSMGLGNVFDGILDSYRLRALKEDFLPAGESAFFGPFLERHGIDPRQCVWVDDGDKGEVSRKIGMDFIRVSSPEGVVAALKGVASAK